MFAILAIIAFAIALILNLIGGHMKIVFDAELIGFICLACSLAFGGWAPWANRRSGV